MTWCKLGTEFFNQLVDADFPAALDDACQLTHTQALHYLYSVEAMDLQFKKSTLRRFATSARAADAAAALVDAGAWMDLGDRYQIVHHGDVFRQSLSYQLKDRVAAKERMRRKREQEGDVRQNVRPNVLQNVRGTQSVSQTGRSSEAGTSSTATIPPAVTPIPAAPSASRTDRTRDLGEQAS